MRGEKKKEKKKRRKKKKPLRSLKLKWGEIDKICKAALTATVAG